MKTYTTIGLIGTIVAAATAGNAAERDHYTRQATVYVADLDLGREPDAQVVYERIGYAARAICTADDLSFAIEDRRDWRQCVRAAVTEAVDRADAPVLSEIHERHGVELAGL